MNTIRAKECLQSNCKFFLIIIQNSTNVPLIIKKKYVSKVDIINFSINIFIFKKL